MSAFENECLEYKRVVDNRNLPRVAVAFANSRGGKIMIGVDDDRTIIGVKGQTVEDVANIIRDGCVPPLIPHVNKENYDGKDIITVVVKA